AAKADIARLAELGAQLREAKDAYWAEQVDIQWQAASAWLLYAQGKYDDALKTMSAAADAEDKTEKSPVTPGPLAPARELYGAMLLDRGMAKDALAAYEATLKKEPHRLGATLGAAKAAEKAGDPGKARQHYAATVALTENADGARPEVAAARVFVGQARGSQRGDAFETSAPTISVSGHGCCRAAIPRADGGGASLSNAARAADHRLPSRRLGRHHRAADRPMVVGSPGSAGRHRKPAGRGHQYRDRDRRECAAGRLYAPPFRSRERDQRDAL